MVFRVEKTKDYTTMSNYHLREKEMSLKAKGLLSWMLSNANDWDYSIQGIVACCKENETAIESALDELKKFGYLTVTKLMPNQTESGRIEYVYDVHEKPKKQGVEKQGVENLPLEIQGVENQVQRNTIVRNTKKEIKNNNTILKNSTAEPPITKSQIITKRNLPNINDDFSEKEFKEEKPKSKRKNLYEKCLAEIDNFTEGDDVDLKAALKTYLEIRLKMKDKPILGVGQWKGLLKTLNTLTGDKVAIVERATERGWGSFFELKDFSYQKKPNSKPDYSIFGETKEMKNVLPNEVEGGEFSGHIF